jgi:hypothetical protein
MLPHGRDQEQAAGCARHGAGKVGAICVQKGMLHIPLPTITASDAGVGGAAGTAELWC